MWGAGLGFLPHDDALGGHPPELDVTIAYVVLPPGLGNKFRSRKASLRCQADGRNATLPLGRLPWPGRGTGRNAWVFPPGLDAGLVRAAVLNIPRDTTGDVAVLVLGAALEGNTSGAELEPRCAPLAQEAARAEAAASLAGEAPGACVVESDGPGGAEAVCAVADGEAGGGRPVAAAEACGGTVRRVFKPDSAGAGHSWGGVEAEDAARTLRDPASLDHDGHADPRAAAHARLVAAEGAHARCVRGGTPGGEWLEEHGSARLVGVVEPVGWPRDGEASPWGQGAPTCPDDAAGREGGVASSAGEAEPPSARDASLLQAGAEARAGALAGVRERLEAGIPGLDLMLGPVMDSVLGPVTQIIGGVVGDVVGAGLMNLVGQSTDSALTAETSKILTSDLVGALADQVVPPTGEAVAASVTSATSALVRSMVPATVGDALADDIVAKLVPRLAPALAERISERVADAVAEPLAGTLQHMLSRSITAASVPALAHSLTHSPSADYFCLLCKEKNLYCSYCKASQFPATLAHAQYYAAYYGAYYAEWGGQPRAQRAGQAAAAASKAASERAAVDRKSQSEWMAAHKD